jgi:hypothetical protein
MSACVKWGPHPKGRGQTAAMVDSFGAFTFELPSGS